MVPVRIVLAMASLLAVACRGERKPPPPVAAPTDAAQAPVDAVAVDATAPVYGPAPASLAFVRGQVVTLGVVDGHRRPLALDAGTATWQALGSGEVDLFPTGHRLGGAVLCIAARGHDDADHLEHFALVRGAAVEAIGPTAQLVRSPSVTADGGLVFETNLASYRDLFFVDRRGRVRRLTDHPAGNFEPALSPDGTTVAFASSRDGNAELYLQPLAGGPPRRFTDERRDDWGPAWSPDGRRLAFLSDRDGRERVYLVEVEGGVPRRVTSHTDATGEAEPRWSPDGRYLALVRGFGVDLAVDVVEVATGAARTLTAKGGSDLTFAWSPDSAYLAVARRDAGAARIAFVRVADGVEVAAVPSDSDLVRWLP